jgi:predicted nucleotidyltransferase
MVVSFAPECIVLFGSRAKGTSHTGSDVDLLIITNQNGNATIRQLRTRQIVAACFPPVDVVFCNTQEVNAAASGRSPFLLSVLETGRIIYRRSGEPNADPNAIDPLACFDSAKCSSPYLHSLIRGS